MKKTILMLLLICSMTPRLVFGQTSQSITFAGPQNWLPGTTVNLNVFLTFSGYNALGLSYWLEVPTPLAPFINITNAQYFTFTDPNNIFGFPITFTDMAGASTGYMDTNRDLGAITAPTTPVSPGTYQIATLTFSIAPGTPTGIYTMFTTSLAPRHSEVTDTGFHDNDIIPPGQFVIIRGIPEPGTLALVTLGGLGTGLLVYRRKSQS